MYFLNICIYCIYTFETIIPNFLKSSPEDMFIDFRERGKGREREREKHLCERETLIGCLPYTL